LTVVIDGCAVLDDAFSASNSHAEPAPR
jgi:hypothetical protein